MPRAIWKGAISFGLVHVPVALMPAASESGIDFDWIDKRSMDPVGYRRINKRTGKEIESSNIVRGIKVGDGEYVVLGDDEIAAAYPKTTQTIEIEAFVKQGDIPFTMLERPYFLSPVSRGEKVYALLRESMRAGGVVGIARLVLHTKEHLAVLVPVGAALMLNTLRWASELRPADDIELPADGKGQLKAGELKMAAQLIEDMTVSWKPGDYTDRFTDAVHALVEQRVASGRTAAVTPLEDAPKAEGGGGNVIELTELLRRSLNGRRDAPAKAPKAAAPRAAKPAAKAGRAKTKKSA